MPGVALTGRLCHDIVGAVVDGEVQRDYAVRTVDVSEVPRVVTGSGEGFAIPNVRLTLCSIEFGCGRVENGQPERVHLRAAVGIGVRVEVSAGGVVGLPVTVRPGVGVVSGDGVGLVYGMIDGELQGVHAGAAVGIGVWMRVGAGRCIRLPVPSVALTNRLRLHVVRAVVYGQLQCIDARTAIGVVVGVGVCS